MDKQQVLVCAASVTAILTVCLIKMKKKKRETRRIWVRPWVARRELKGIHQNLLRELQSEDIKAYKNYLRMDEDTFQFIVAKISPLICRQNTHLRNPISVEERLMVTLRFLATEQSYASLQYSSRIPQCTLSGMIPETCEAIYRALKGEYLKVPSTVKEWEDIAREFENKWNVFNTIGAMDGKHIRITCPEMGGSHFFNYKSYHSIVLFALAGPDYKFLYVDVGTNGRIGDSGGSHFFNYKSYHSIVLFALAGPDYKFLYVDVGTNGRIGDSGVYAKSKLRKCLIDRTQLNIPDGRKLPSTNIVAPYVVLADDAFPLSYNIMKPYPLKNITKEEKIFNYRLSRGRRMVESSFGILASRFRVFLTPINLSPEKVTLITLAACTLHNLLTEKRKHLYTRQEIIYRTESGQQFLDIRSEEELPEMEPLLRQHEIGGNRHGREIRDLFKDFYNGPGAVPWQDKYV